jgi:hypothetical protein
MLDDVKELEGGLPPEELEDDQKGGLPPEGDEGGEDGQQPKETVEDRLSRLQAEFEHERALKQAERRTRRTAQDNLANTRRENEELKKRLDDLERRSEEDQRARVDADRSSRAAAAEVKLAEAHEAGDPKAIARAQRELTAIELEAARSPEPKPEAKRPEPKPEPRAAEPEPEQEQVEYPDAAVAWMGRTPWYHSAQNERDQRDAQTAYNVLQGLQAQGYDTSVPEFYQAADNILRGILPHRYQQQQRQTMEQPRGNGVARTAGAGRGNGTGDNREPAIPPGVLEKARRMGRPVNDPEYRKRLAKYVLNPSGDRP